jgi:hypothetical protein
VPTREAPGTPGQRSPMSPDRASGPISFSFSLRKFLGSPCIEIHGTEHYLHCLAQKTKIWPGIAASASAEPHGTACAVRAILGSLTGGASRFARRHPRLLLFVRFADKARLWPARDPHTAVPPKCPISRGPRSGPTHKTTVREELGSHGDFVVGIYHPYTAGVVVSRWTDRAQIGFLSAQHTRRIKILPIERKRNHVNKHHPASPRATCDP